MRWGTEALAASRADAEWVATAGDAVDIAEILANRSALQSSLLERQDIQKEKNESITKAC